jgi:tetratricopeptide (TPR) repeat protein
MTTTANSGGEPIEPIVQYIHALHVAGAPSLRGLAWEEVEAWICCGAWEKLCFVLRELPLSIVPETPAFFYVRGQVLWEQHRLGEAASFLERARFFYRMTQNDRSLAALCCIDLAELAHVQCRLSIAERYLQAAETSLSSTAAPNPSVVARFHWMQASVLAALGAASQAIHHAQIAVALYETLKDVLSQLRCLATLAEAAVAAGDLELAASQIAVARSLFAAAVIPPRACAHILNVEVHLAWQSGNLAQAASAAEQLLRCCQDIPDRCLYSVVGPSGAGARGLGSGGQLLRSGGQAGCQARLSRLSAGTGDPPCLAACAGWGAGERQGAGASQRSADDPSAVDGCQRGVGGDSAAGGGYGQRGPVDDCARLCDGERGWAAGLCGSLLSGVDSVSGG